MVVSSSDTDRLYVAGKRWLAARAAPALHRSSNGGYTWTTYAITSKSGLAASIALDPTDEDVIYIGGYTYDPSRKGALYKSMNGGISWQTLAADTFGGSYHSVQRVVVDPTANNILYALTNIKAFRSEDFGVTWKEITPAKTNMLETNSILVDPLASRKLYLATSEGVFYSGDSGGSWQPINKNLTIPYAISLELNPYKGYLYVGTLGGGTFRCKTKHLK